MSTALIIIEVADKAFAGANLLKHLRDEKFDGVYQELVRDAVTMSSSLFTRMQEVYGLTERQIIDHLTTAMSPQSYRRMVAASLVSAAMAPTMGKMCMLSAFAAYVHFAKHVGTLARVGRFISEMDPLDALHLRALCFTSGRYDNRQSGTFEVAEFGGEPPVVAPRIRMCLDGAVGLAPEDPSLVVNYARLVSLQLIQYAGTPIRQRREAVFDLSGLKRDYHQVLSRFATDRPMALAYEVSKALLAITEAELQSDSANRPEAGT